MHRPPLLLLAAAFARAVLAKTVQVTLPIVNAPLAPDGFLRSTVVPDGTFPGPLISGQKGDKFDITVQNNLYDEDMLTTTSVHWHGIHMRGTNWADGSASVTQCPIIPNDSFKYVLDLSDTTGSAQTGTFWYHSHLSSQYCDGLRGPLVVYDSSDAKTYGYDIDNEDTIISLADWYHTYGAAFHPGQFPHPFPDSNLINGKGYSPTSNTTSADGLAVITVEQGKRYRMRVIQMACYSAYTYSVDAHSLTIIEADSISSKPLVVDSFKIYPGQRYSYILNADQPVGNYWMRSLPDPDPRGPPSYANNANVAILRYVGASLQDPSTPANQNVPALTNTLNENDLEPYVSEDAPGPAQLGAADVSMTIVSSFNTTGDNLFRMNNQTFKGPELPVLLQILNGAMTADNLLPTGSVYPLPPNKVIEVTLLGTPLELGGPHPFHLHGHDFFLVKSADATSPKFTNPIQRDTASSGLQGNSTTIRFVTDNTGPWFLHCHIDWHLDMGMGIVFAEDVEDTKADDVPTKEWNDLCPAYDAYIKEANAGDDGDDGP